MNKEICFIIDSKELILEQVLVDYNDIPVYFVCKDIQNQYYIILCTDIDNEKYIITKTQISKLIQLLTQEITMRDLIICESDFWDISAGDNIEDDIYEKKSMELINLEDLPYDNSYFKVVTKAHKNFLSKLKDLFLSQIEQWETFDFIINNNELNDFELCSNQNNFLNKQVDIREVREIKSIQVANSNCMKNFNISFENIGKTNQIKSEHIESNYILKSNNLKDSNNFIAA